MLDVVLILAAVGCWLAASLSPMLRSADDKPHLGFGLLGSLLACVGALHSIISGVPSGLDFSFWGMPARLEVDALSGAFLLPLHLVAGLGIVYGHAYWPLGARKDTARSLRFFYGLLVAAMSGVFIARQGVVFLIAWEVMALAAFFLVGTDHDRPEVRRASWVYLVCTHTGTLMLIAMVALLAQRTGGFMWLSMRGLAPSGLDVPILLLALAGFGFKAGFLPLHFWLPDAHAGAPSHVSAILSAVLLKTGIYGILRISGLMPVVPPFLGGFLLVLGAITAVYGVGNALAQSDYKRLLAYSSIENIGIIAMGIGLAWVGQAYHESWITALGFAGAIFHIWNHAIFKSLLFFGAGSVLHATGTRQVERLGGLGSRMPRTAFLLFPAVLAVTALPPFNAFLSEWFLYRGLFSSFLRAESWSTFLALPALALTGGLAAVAFAKFYGFLFLGVPRSSEAEHAHDPGPAMLIPMAILAVLCLALGFGSVLLLPLLDRVVAVLAPEATGIIVAGLGRDLQLLTGVMAILVVLGVGLFLWLRRYQRHALTGVDRPPTWDCGYAQPTARMQYSGSSFSDGWAAILPGLKVRMRRIKGLFPRGVSFHTDLRDAVGEGLLEPRIEHLAARLLRFRQLQHGHLSLYVLYILLALLGIFLWMLVRPGLLG